MDAPETTSTTLLARVKEHNQDAWQRLTDLYGPAVYGWCRRCGLNAEDAADVVQEVFSAVARKVEDFRRDRPDDSFRGWLCTITHNKVRDHFRRQQDKPQAEGGTLAQQRLAELAEELSQSFASISHAPEEDAVDLRAIELVRAGIEDHTWQAFWRLVVEGHSVADVGKDLGMSQGAVYKAKYRVMHLVRKEYEDLIE